MTKTANTAKRLVKFNVQNPKYSVLGTDGAWGELQPLGDARKIALETDASKKAIYGNGIIKTIIVNDKGKTGTLTVNVVPDEYEVAMGRKLRTSNGLADIKQRVAVTHCIYFETCSVAEDNSQPLAKTIIYGCTSERPAESYDQTEDDINESTFDIPLEIRGVPVLNSDKTIYKDKYGMEVYAWQMTLTPEDEGYDDFGKTTVTLPIMTVEGV